MDSTALGEKEYMITIRGNNVATGTVEPDRVMVISEQWDSVGHPVPKDVITGVDPTYQAQAYWVKASDAEGLEGITGVSATDVIVTH